MLGGQMNTRRTGRKVRFVSSRDIEVGIRRARHEGKAHDKKETHQYRMHVLCSMGFRLRCYLSEFKVCTKARAKERAPLASAKGVLSL